MGEWVTRKLSWSREQVMHSCGYKNKLQKFGEKPKNTEGIVFIIASFGAVEGMSVPKVCILNAFILLFKITEIEIPS